MPRTIAIGDIHGHLQALKVLARHVPFEADDRIVALGDYVDRGPDSSGVLDWMIEWHATGQLIPLLGNHDLMMRDAPHDEDMFDLWLAVGGKATLYSYRTDESRAIHFSDITEAHWDFLRNDCRRYFETDTHIFAHAGVAPFLPLERQKATALFWDKLVDPRPHESGKTVICGHTAQRSGQPLNFGHTICIDTWVYGAGWLTCLDVDSGQYWQARDDGALQTANLADLQSSS